jgi:hypothetical protein
MLAFFSSANFYKENLSGMGGRCIFRKPKGVQQCREVARKKGRSSSSAQNLAIYNAWSSGTSYALKRIDII